MDTADFSALESDFLLKKEKRPFCLSLLFVDVDWSFADFDFVLEDIMNSIITAQKDTAFAD